MGKKSIFCKECRSENEAEADKCVKCGAALSLQNTPLDGTDRVKIISLFAILVLPLFGFGFGVIPFLIIVAAIYIMKKDKTFLPILKARQYILYYLIVSAILGGMLVIVLAIAVNFLPGMSALILVYAIYRLLVFMFDYLFFDPLKKRKDWVVEHGIFADSENKKGDNLVSAIDNNKWDGDSVADELVKISGLFEKGLISKEEFEKAKDKLLNR